MPCRPIELTAVSPEFAGKSWRSATLLRVGRVGALEVRLEHTSVSRHHAEIATHEDGWVVRDLGSTNGTMLNGVRIGQVARALDHGDAIRFGQVAMSVAFPADAEASPHGGNGSSPRRERANAASASATAAGTPGATHDLVVQTVTALAQAVELRDKYTGGHTQRVTTYALLLAERLGLSQQDRRLLQIGVPLHDIGKIGVDDAVLRKPGQLTAEEFDSMRSHTVQGADILASIPDLAAVLPIVRSHHERWDGLGYPDGLAGDAIPLLSRVVAVADAFDAMISDRPYRKGLPLYKAFAEVAAQAGSQFDPRCVQAFLELRSQIAELLRQRADAGNGPFALPYRQRVAQPRRQDVRDELPVFGSERSALTIHRKDNVAARGFAGKGLLQQCIAAPAGAGRRQEVNFACVGNRIPGRSIPPCPCQQQGPQSQNRQPTARNQIAQELEHDNPSMWAIAVAYKRIARRF